MPRVGELFEALHIIRSAQADADKETIAAVVADIEQRLAGHGNDALPFFPGALGDQLLHPEAERIERSGGDQRQLVAALLGHGADDRAEHRRRILLR